MNRCAISNLKYPTVLVTVGYFIRVKIIYISEYSFKK